MKFRLPIVEIRSVAGHYEVYVNGVFYCSTDTMAEARREARI